MSSVPTEISAAPRAIDAYPGLQHATSIEIRITRGPVSIGVVITARELRAELVTKVAQVLVEDLSA